MPSPEADLARRPDSAANEAAAAFRARFAAGPAGTIYLDASSIGPMPSEAPRRMAGVLDEGWRIARRRAWNETDWLAQPRTLGAAIAPVLGAAPDDVLVCDATSLNQYKLLRHALAVNAPRRTIVVERDVFPSNRHVAEGIAHAGLATLRLVGDAADPDALHAVLAGGDVAAVALSHVDYRSSRRLDMAAINTLVHAHGALALWDLSHSAGAVSIDLRGTDADLAVGCGYKYLCGGPGAPGFLYVHPRWRTAAWPAICGWMGHADTFGFEGAFRPAEGIGRFQAATPPVLANAAFSAAADVWAEVPPALLDARHRSLGETLLALLEEHGAPFGLELASPREAARRGGHVAVRFEGAAPLAQALVAAGVVVSARKPDALRFAVHPLVTTHDELREAIGRLRTILAEGSWRDARFAGQAV